MTNIDIELERPTTPSGEDAWDTVHARRATISVENVDGFERTLVTTGGQPVRDDDDYTAYLFDGATPYQHLLGALDGTPFRTLMPDMPSDPKWRAAAVTVTFCWYR